MNPASKPFKLAWLAMWRMASYSFCGGLLLGSAVGIIAGTIEFLAILIHIPRGAFFPGILLGFLPAWLLYAIIGASIGAFIGVLVGLSEGFALGLLTGLHFYPLTDIHRYRQFVRRTIVVVTPALTLACLFTLPIAGVPHYIVSLSIPIALCTCGIAWWYAPRFVRWYIYVSKSVDEIVMIRHTKQIP